MARKPKKNKPKPSENRIEHPIYGLLMEQEYNERLVAKSLKFEVYPVMRKSLQNRFAVGDLLNRWTTHVSANGEDRSRFYDCLDKDRKLRRIVMVVCTDDVGLTYGRQYGADGRLCSGIQCLHADTWEYELDPDYQDSILLGDGKMNAGEVMRAKAKHKAQVDAHNAKLEIKLTLDEIVKMINERAADGRPIWFKSRGYQNNAEKMVVLSPIQPSSLTFSCDVHWMCGATPHRRTMSATQFTNYIFYSEAPRECEEKR